MKTRQSRPSDAWSPVEKDAEATPLDRDASPARLAAVLGDAFGTAWLEWEPETLWSEIRRTFASPASEIVREKIQATKTLLTTDAFWRDHLVFEKASMAFNNHVPHFDQYQHPSPAMIANAVEEASKINEGKFSDEVLRYIAAICYDDGLIVAPAPIDVAQGHLDELTIRIVGRQLREEIARRWAEVGVNGLPDGLYTETVSGIQMAKLLAIREYVRTF